MTTLTLTSAQTAANTTAAAASTPAPAAPAAARQQEREVRGFALYVGLADDKIADGDPRLGEIVSRVKELLAELAPAAESYAAVALAPKDKGGRDLDVVRLALGEPAAHRARQEYLDSIRPNKDQDRAAAGVEIDFSRRRVLLDSLPAALTYREFELLQFLVLREGRTVSREELIAGVWGDSEDAPSARTVDVHVRRLRIKLAQYQDIVRTVRGAGYRFDRHADVRVVAAAAPSPDVF